MKAIELVIKDETYRVVRNTADNYTFSVFNHATCHIIARNNFGLWEEVRHLFGAEVIPVEEIGHIIDQRYTPWPTLRNSRQGGQSLEREL